MFQAVIILKALTEVALFAFVGQAILYLFAGPIASVILFTPHSEC